MAGFLIIKLIFPAQLEYPACTSTSARLAHKQTIATMYYCRAATNYNVLKVYIYLSINHLSSVGASREKIITTTIVLHKLVIHLKETRTLHLFCQEEMDYNDTLADDNLLSIFMDENIQKDSLSSSKFQDLESDLLMRMESTKSTLMLEKDHEEIKDTHDMGDHSENGELLVLVPKVGMMFNSEEEVYSFYIRYAQKEGFGITKSRTKNGVDGNLKYYSLACVRAGKRISTAKNSFIPRPSIKNSCKAKINIIIGSGQKFSISSVFLDHNHQLSPQKSRLFRCNKNIDEYVRRRLEVNDQADISLNKNFHSLALEVGGYENLMCTEKDCRNYISKAREIRLGVGDAKAFRNYFSRMQMRNPSFFYVIDMDEDRRLKNVFWADARSIAAYESFGDVISFDSTYLTNKYDMPFAPFVGVNHHGHTILFGCGLLSSEDTETYIWLFKSWLECMSNRAPKAIITDQCKAMKAAIKKVFPNSYHRLCLWHIMRKIPEKLGGLAEYKTIKKIMKSAVYESVEIEEFEMAWGKMINDFSLEHNEWLKSLFIDRSCWVPVYVKRIFWAGMSTTQRSESINAFFDGYVGPTTSLKQFVEQYDHALKSKIEKEHKADFASLNSNIPTITDCHFEKQFRDAYTNEIFKLFQDELRGMIYCNHIFSKLEGSVSSYKVSDIFRGKDGNLRKQVVYNVDYDDDTISVKCSCQLFEFRGIIYKHIAKILIEKNVKEIPSNYILQRWRKDAAELAMDSTEKCEFLMNHIDEGIKKLMDDSKKATSKEIIDSDEPNENLDDKLLTPLKARTKGRPPSKRKESKVERIVKKQRKKKNEQSQNISDVSKKRKICKTFDDARNQNDISPNILMSQASESSAQKSQEYMMQGTNSSVGYEFRFVGQEDEIW
ncbi:protein FAR1-RELATED SEQUENCE 6-like [Mercurialis annua]|uniref:protein FAR1-RELATED SEQUENCE 6-like n=1 Tax=Mercurialis annua TaxID=3986 RepID=UPI002160F3AD|nr:protein FAR1-RELATED SEQUENCE 6-like [Mercurialis annua]